MNIISIKGFKKIILCSLIATFIALTFHICYDHILNLLQELWYPSLPNTTPHYPNYIIAFAYITAFISITFLTFIYYFCQDLVPTNSIVCKFLLVTIIILGIKQELVRMPIMDSLVLFHQGIKNFLLLSLAKHLDHWITNLLMVSSIVLFCPTNDKTKC